LDPPKKQTDPKAKKEKRKKKAPAVSFVFFFKGDVIFFVFETKKNRKRVKAKLGFSFCCCCCRSAMSVTDQAIRECVRGVREPSLAEAELRGSFGQLPPCPLSCKPRALPCVLLSAEITTRVCLAAFNASGGEAGPRALAHVKTAHPDIPPGAWRAALQRFEDWLRKFYVERSATSLEPAGLSDSDVVFLATLALRRLLLSDRHFRQEAQEVCLEWTASEVYARCEDLHLLCSRASPPEGQSAPGSGRFETLQRLTQSIRLQLRTLEAGLATLLYGRNLGRAAWRGASPRGPSSSGAGEPPSRQQARRDLLATGARVVTCVRAELEILQKFQVFFCPEAPAATLCRGVDAFLTDALQREPDSSVKDQLKFVLYRAAMPLALRQRFLQVFPLQSKKVSLVDVLYAVEPVDGVVVLQKAYEPTVRALVDKGRRDGFPFRDLVDVSVLASFLAIRYNLAWREKFFVDVYTLHDRRQEFWEPKRHGWPRRPLVTRLLGQWVVVVPSSRALVPCATSREAMATWLGLVWFGYQGKLVDNTSLLDIKLDVARLASWTEEETDACEAFCKRVARAT
jgi:hypothetical protein